MHTRRGLILLLLGLALEVVHGQGKAVSRNTGDSVSQKVDSLKAVIVTASMRPRTKADTLEYNASNIVLPPNAVVEDMLRRLPGLHIDPDGSVSYNGQKIDHLLIDGVDVFGDPTMVTRSFDASKISRVQILDRKSEQAVFTGIDDGTRVKTLNLLLRNDAKDGYFGNVETAGGFGSYYTVNGALASFRGKEQLTALAVASNTGTTSFTGNAVGAATGINLLDVNSDPMGASAGVGIPRFEGVAVHYSNSWSGAADGLTANYQYSHYSTLPVTVTQSLQSEPDGSFGQNQRNQSMNRQLQHWVYGIYDWIPNSRMALKFVFHGVETSGRNSFEENGRSALNDTLVNIDERRLEDNVYGQNIGGNVWWRTMIGKKAGQAFSVSVGAAKVDDVTNGFLYSSEEFYQPDGDLKGRDTADQRKLISGHSLSIDGSMNYTEPVWKGALLGISYGAYYSGDEPLQATYDRGDGKYQEEVDSLSGNFRTRTMTQRTTGSLQGALGNVKYTLGVDWLGYSYMQRDLLADSAVGLQNGHVAPRLLLNYTPDPAMNISVIYLSSTQQPTGPQLAPVANNSDPLHVAEGNPRLKVGFNQNVSLELHRFKKWQLDIRMRAGLLNNTISTKVTMDTLGRQISQPVNVNGGKTWGFNFSMRRKLSGVDLGVQVVGSYSRTLGYVNEDLSKNDAYIWGGGFSLGRFATNKYSIQLNANFTYFDQTASVNTLAPVRYWSQSHEGLLSIYLIPGFELGTGATYTWQGNTNAFSATSALLLWNSYVVRNFLHNRLVAKVQFNNMLNDNSGISRTYLENVNTQTSTNIVGRYWMLSVTYHFDKKFKK